MIIKELPDQDELRKILHYDPGTGVFTWRVSPVNSTKVGSIAGCVEEEGYIVIGINYVGYKAHRLAFVYMLGREPSRYVDHINRDRSDNRWCNLREATRAENSRNAGTRRDNTSGVVGVSWHKQTGKWRAKITVDGQQISLGLYADKADAAKVRRDAEEKHYGAFAPGS